ncbi:MAG: pyridoxamine 5'-phosphate oxidase family protein [Alphaproteobacteria bacterium]|nr:pyridoxamine 5'-phosphate oxidase family protein [Alphaproteobacteria bacterium]
MIDLGDNNPLVSRRILRMASFASLATLKDGLPYASLVTPATAHDGSPLLLLSKLADHTQNLLANERASLLFALPEGHANPQTAPRVTVMGRLLPSDLIMDRARYLARNPGAALYAGFADFSIWRMAVERFHFVGGFGRAVWLEAKHVLLDQKIASLFAESEGKLIERFSQKQTGVCAVDADGIDVGGQDGGVKRLLFARPLASPDEALDAPFLEG